MSATATAIVPATDALVLTFGDVSVSTPAPTKGKSTGKPAPAAGKSKGKPAAAASKSKGKPAPAASKSMGKSTGMSTRPPSPTPSVVSEAPTTTSTAASTSSAVGPKVLLVVCLYCLLFFEETVDNPVPNLDWARNWFPSVRDLHRHWKTLLKGSTGWCVTSYHSWVHATKEDEFFACFKIWVYGTCGSTGWHELVVCLPLKESMQTKKHLGGGSIRFFWTGKMLSPKYVPPADKGQEKVLDVLLDQPAPSGVLDAMHGLYDKWFGGKSQPKAV